MEQNRTIKIVSEVGRALALITLILYSWHFSNAIVGNLSAYVQAEKAALRALTPAAQRAIPQGAEIPLGEGVGGLFGEAAAANAFSWIFVCILAIIYFVLVFPVWLERIVRIWRVIGSCRGFFGCLFSWIMAIIETIAFILITVVAILFIIVNIVAFL